MKLIVSRRQPAKYLYFEVFCTLVLSEEESALLRKYGQEKHKIGEITDITRAESIDELVKRPRSECFSDVRKALAWEQKMKDDCASLKQYLEMAASYGGTQEFTF